MLCPNEKAGCAFDRDLSPPFDGKEMLYENLKGTFRLGDLCAFYISIPPSADLNDMMYIRMEYFKDCKVTLIKGLSMN